MEETGWLQKFKGKGYNLAQFWIGRKIRVFVNSNEELDFYYIVWQVHYSKISIGESSSNSSNKNNSSTTIVTI